MPNSKFCYWLFGLLDCLTEVWINKHAGSLTTYLLNKHGLCIMWESRTHPQQLGTSSTCCSSAWSHTAVCDWTTNHPIQQCCAALAKRVWQIFSSNQQLKLGYIWVFQQRRDPKHAWELVLGWIKQAHIKLLEWPFQSIHLSPLKTFKTESVLGNQPVS